MTLGHSLAAGLARLARPPSNAVRMSDRGKVLARFPAEGDTVDATP